MHNFGQQQTKGLIPFSLETFLPMACLYFLRMFSRLPSCQAFSNEEITTGHCSSSSKYAYFSPIRRGLRSSFWCSVLPSFSPPSRVNKGRISSFLLHAHKLHITLGLPAELQKVMLVPQPIPPVVAAAETVHPGWCQSYKPLLDPHPLGACAFFLGGKY